MHHAVSMFKRAALSSYFCGAACTEHEREFNFSRLCLIAFGLFPSESADPRTDSAAHIQHAKAIMTEQGPISGTFYG